MLHPSKERPPRTSLQTRKMRSLWWNLRTVVKLHTHTTADRRARKNWRMAEFNFSQKYCEIEKQHWHNFPLTSWYWVDIENNEPLFPSSACRLGQTYPVGCSPNTKSSQTVFLMKYMLCLHVRGPPKKFQILISIFVRSLHTFVIGSFYKAKTTRKQVKMTLFCISCWSQCWYQIFGQM